MLSKFHQFGALLLMVLVFTSKSAAQSTSFTYQGRLADGGTAANGNYDLQFALFDSLSGGTQIGATQTLSTVPVSNGVFTVSLDFGASSFSGANRFLEISARPSGAGSFTLLTPRQPVTPTPYAVRSASASAADALSSACSDCVQDSQINSVSGSKVSGTVASATNATNAANATNATTATNATQLGGIAASQYVQTSDSRLSDPRPPTPGSSNYIQNSTNQQGSTNFNISGNGTVAGSLSAGTQFNIGVNRVLGISGAGSDGGGSLTTSNTFAGIGAGSSNTPAVNGDGNRNTFFGNNAGNANTIGSHNAFFGTRAGKSNTSAFDNSYFGDSAGLSNTLGSGNSFFGFGAASRNTTGDDNSFFGDVAANNNTLGQRNSFFGHQAGNANTIGSDNTLLGANTDLGSNNLTNATAIGASAFVTQSNSLVLGSIANVNGATANTNVGIGTTAPQAKLHVVGNVRVDGGITLASLGTASNPQATLCRNTSSEIAFCNSSSLRYKNNITPFIGGLDIVKRLRPINFTWKQDGAKDIGFGAEEVERVAPLFTFKNDKGEIEGVRYDRLGVVFVNAFKEQQAQIEQQQQLIKQQQAEARQQQAEIVALNARLLTIERVLTRKSARIHRR